MNNIDAAKTYLITGAAGFIGFSLSRSLLEKGCRVLGIDNINDYYDVNLKYDRLKLLNSFEKFVFLKNDISDKLAVEQVFKEYRPDIVINLAAQPGVRYSLINPDAYIQSNIIGFYNILEACRQNPVRHLVYASSSSVYGMKERTPSRESDLTDQPVSLYAATKKSNELMAYTYSYLYKIPATGLRFFTVYGPYGRPDMAYFKFANQYFVGDPITINSNNEDDSYRDYTYIDDVVEGIEKILDYYPAGHVPHCVYNIGNCKPESLPVFIGKLEKSLSEAAGREIVFQKTYQPIQPGDVTVTYASTDLITNAVGFMPKTSTEDGLKKFASWYIHYYNIK